MNLSQRSSASRSLKTDAMREAFEGVWLIESSGVVEAIYAIGGPGQGPTSSPFCEFPRVFPRGRNSRSTPFFGENPKTD